MIDTARIRSEFDVEVQLGSGWFFTAFRALHENGLLLPDPLPPPLPPDAQVVIMDVEIILDEAFDLQIDVTVDGDSATVLAALALSEDGSELVVTTNLPDVEFTVPFEVLDDLAGPPALQKLDGTADTDRAMAVLANLDLRASDQAGEPKPPDEHVERGDPELAQSFLPAGQDVALGVGSDTFPRLANNLWHTDLRAADGSHPFPDEDDPKGEWSVVSMTPQADRIRVQLEGDIPVDSPLIDLVPDPHVTVTLDLTPSLDDGSVVFEIEVDSNVDTGLLGDLFAFLTGGFVGFVVGLLGGPILAVALAGVGAVGSVIALEVAEAIVEGTVERRLRAEIDGEAIPSILTCRDGVVTEAAATAEDDAFSLGPLDTIPRSIPLVDDEPDPLYRRFLLMTAAFDELQLDEGGLGMAGPATDEERFQPNPAALTDRVYVDDELASLQYRLTDGSEVDVPAGEALQRMEEAEIRAPFDVRPEPAEAAFRRPEGRLPTVCLRAESIRREDTVVTEIRFDSGVDLRVEDAVHLQDAGGLVVRHLQLIHPENASPYYRSFADSTTENNLENLPRF